MRCINLVAYHSPHTQPALWHIEDVRALRVDLSALSVTVETEKPGAGGTKSIETLVS